MTDAPSPSPPEASISDHLRRIIEAEDLDACAIVANVINTYLDAIKRRGGRTDLYADDISAILKITRLLLNAGDIGEELAQFIGRKNRLAGKPQREPAT